MICIGEGSGTPLQYSCLENPMDRGACWAAVHGVAKSWTRLSNFTFTFHFHALEKEMATHSRVLAWRIPGTGEPGGLPSLGSHRVGHDWSDLAAAAAAAVWLMLSINISKLIEPPCPTVLSTSVTYYSIFFSWEAEYRWGDTGNVFFKLAIFSEVKTIVYCIGPLMPLNYDDELEREQEQICAKNSTT